jgi:hypothetical protein
MKLQNDPDRNRLIITDAPFAASLSIRIWQEGRFHPVPVELEDDAITGERNGARVSLVLTPSGPDWRYHLSLTSPVPTRVQLKLDCPESQEVFHLIPGCIHGDNAVEASDGGHFPHLTRSRQDPHWCSPYWEMRADRAALPVSMSLFQGGAAALSIDPYSPAPQDTSTSREGFIRNGVFAELDTACGVTLGYRNMPVSYINKEWWGTVTEHRVQTAKASGFLLLQSASSRLAAHDIMERLYYHYRPPGRPDPEIGKTARHLVDAFLTINWQPEKRNFSNMHCGDISRRHLTAWRTVAEVGWTGGGILAYPLLAAGILLDDPTACERAHTLFDRVAGARNPASGLLWDVAGETEGKGVNGWWAGYMVKDVHCAYTNGSGVLYLLRGYDFEKKRGREHRTWLETACAVLDTVVQLQQSDGNFGYTYRTDRPEIVDPEGFAGAYLIPALALAYQHTRKTAYLQAAERAATFYGGFVRDLCCIGTPMDTWKSPEEEGNLGYLRGVTLLHDITGSDTYLELMEASAQYEYLWRYGYTARPEFPPLKGSGWNSCGGSITSVSNPHIHPMGLTINPELDHLARLTGRQYHRDRYQDGLCWGAEIVSLYPHTAGYGAPGVLTERFCPSDGLTIETMPDGYTPSSLWFSYNAWAAASVLESLVIAVPPNRSPLEREHPDKETPS